MTDDTKPDRSEKKHLKRFSATSPRQRFIKLTGMSTSIATRMTANRVKGLFQSKEERKESQQKLLADIGVQIAETLGEMKGAVMKVGQIASQVKDLLPPEIAEALESLQKDSPPMPFRLIRRQILQELGSSPYDLFAEIDEEPFAAASIGQVHKARTRDGVDVVVKIQYPGVEESCESDLRQIRRLMKLAGLVRIDDAVMDDLFQEIRDSLYRELDYEQEAENARFFYEKYQDRDDIIVPRVIDELTSKRVLTLTAEMGDSMETVASSPAYSQAMRNKIGQKIFDLFAQQLFEFKAIHADPHPGNFAFRPDGSIILYDFGAVKYLDDDTVETYQKLAADALGKRHENIDASLIRLGVRRPDKPGPGAEYYAGWVDLLYPVFNGEPYDFSKSRLHKAVVKKGRQEGLKQIEHFQPSPKTIAVNRLLSGLYWNMIEIGAQAGLRDEIREKYVDVTHPTG